MPGQLTQFGSEVLLQGLVAALGPALQGGVHVVRNIAYQNIGHACIMLASRCHRNYRIVPLDDRLAVPAYRSAVCQDSYMAKARAYRNPWIGFFASCTGIGLVYLSIGLFGDKPTYAWVGLGVLVVAGVCGGLAVHRVRGRDRTV